MTVNNPYIYVWLLLILFLWCYLLYPDMPLKRPVHKKSFGFMKSILIALAVLAFSGISKKESADSFDLMFVRDVSLSCASQDEEKITAFMKRVVGKMKASNRAGLVAFGRQAYVETELTENYDVDPVRSLPDKTRTDLGKAIQTAVGKMDRNRDGRIILMTDGHENLGSAADAAGLAKALDIEIFPVPIGSWFDSSEVYIEKFPVPRQTALHTPFHIRTVISSTVAADGELLIFANNDLMAKESMKLTPGKNTFVFDDVITEPGVRNYRAIINASPDTIFENNEFVSSTKGVTESGILYVSRTGESAMSKALQTQGMTVDVLPPSGVPDSLSGLLKYRAIVIDNTPATEFSYSVMLNIKSFVVESGGGLVMLGGDQGFGAGHYLNTPIEQVLPVSMDHPTTLENPEFCLLLLIDTSSSMGGYAKNKTKLHGAKIASFSAVELLNPFDRIGLLGFDTAFYWVVPVTQASERSKIAAELSQLTAIGGTDLYPALSHAFETLENITAQKKHIIILSDGKTKEADFKGLIKAMIARNITISTVAVGKTADTGMMKKIAAWGEGRMYYTDDADNIPRIFTGDTRIASQKTIYEERLDTLIQEFKPFLKGVLDDQLPPTRGLVITYPKPGSEIVLNTRRGTLLAVSRQGLGRSIAYTGAFDGRWGKDFVEWPMFERLVSQMMKWVQKSDPGSVFREQIIRNNDQTVFSVDVMGKTGQFVNNAALKLNLMPPSGVKQVILLHQTAPGHYECVFETDQKGQYLLTLFEDVPYPSLPTQTFFMGIPYSDEYKAKGVNLPALQTIARLSGGRMLSLDGEVTAVFKNKNQDLKTGKGMWPWFLMVFSIVFVLDVGVRKILQLRDTAPNKT